MNNTTNNGSVQNKDQQQGEVGHYLRYLIGKQILKKYTQKMINSIRSRMFSQLTQLQFIMLNDQSHYIGGSEQRIYFPWMRSRRKILKKKIFIIKNLLSSIFNLPLFSQENMLIFFINLIDIILFFILGFYFSTMMCFNSTEYMPPYIYSMISVYIYIELFLILVQLNTGVFKQGKYISSRKIIFNQCLHSFTFYSRATIATVFTIIRITNSQNILFIFIIFGHCFTVFNFFTQLQERIIEYQFLKKIVSMLVLLYYAFFIAHLSCLVWIIVGVHETQNKDKSWITQFLKIDESNVDQNKFEIYIASIHYIIVTMVTVGYGDISPTTSSERALNILIMITSSFVFAYIVNAVGQILQEIHNSKKESERKKQVINAYMKKKNVSLQLQQQILQYLYYYWKESKNSKCAEEQQIIEELSDELKQTLLIEANKLVVQESAIFQQNFSESLLQKTVQHIQEIKLCPQQNIFQKGDKDNSAIYFIEEDLLKNFLKLGTIEKYMTLNEGISQAIKGVHVVQTIEKGMYFGVLEFFTGQKRQFNVRSKDFSTLLCIQRQDFINLLQDFNDDYERFCEIKDTLLYTKGQNEMMIKCPSCKQLNHQVDQCPFLHFIPDNGKIITKNQYNYIETNRGTFKRKFTKHDTRNTISNIQTIQTEQKVFVKKSPEVLYLYQIEYLMMDEEDDNDEEDDEKSMTKQSNYEEQVPGQNGINKENSMLMSMSSIDNRQQQFQEFERFKQTRELSTLLQTNQIKLGHSYSGQFFETIQEDSIGKMKKSAFVNSANSSAIGQTQDQIIGNGMQIPTFSVKTPTKQTQMMFDFSQNDQQAARMSLPSITELPSNITQNETPQNQRERKNSIFTLNQMLNPQSNLNTFQSNVPQLSIYSGYQKKQFPEQTKKRNSIETTFGNFNHLKTLRTPNKKSTHKTLFLQVEQQIKNLQEQFIQSQFQQKIQQNDDCLMPYETIKSFQNYKVFYNIDEVLKRFKKSQIIKISKSYTNNFKMSQLAQIKEDDVELKKIISQQMKQIRTINPNAKLTKKQKNHQSSEFDSFNQVETTKKKQLFSDFIFQLNSSSLGIDQSGINLSGLKKSEETRVNGSPFTLEKDYEERYKLEDPVLDSQKSSIYDLKYLPQFNNFETKNNISKQYQDIDMNETYRVDLLN